MEDSEKQSPFPFRCMAETYRLKFRYHFYGNRPTNQLEKPEFYLAYITKEIRAVTPFLESRIKPLLSDEISAVVW
jgi:RAD50-interacting protein 1